VAAITVREYARLTTEPGQLTLDLATIAPSAFKWLLAQRHKDDGLAGRVFQLESPSTIRLGSHVGVIETPCGTQIEILPKYVDYDEDPAIARRLLATMICEALRTTPRTADIAQIELFKVPVSEWVIGQFLQSTAHLLKRGLRQTYARVESQARFLRGRLQVHRQMRGGPASAHVFNIEHDVFTFDRPENRLIRSALKRVLTVTRLPENWRLARELSLVLSEIPPSADIAGDFRQWGRDRLLAHYVAARPWCELILTHQTPFAITGPVKGISMLFPMERLFEEYVTTSLQQALPPQWSLRAQVGDRYLCTYQEKSWFKLKPDILVSDGITRWIVDAKWKLLSADVSRHFDLDQSDFYQMFAYGQKYLGGAGDLYLVYPRTGRFASIHGPLNLSETLRIHVVPFDLFTRRAAFSFLPPTQA
jgi:5-methylcytosine-specific restriction enzyme subunit McrC